MTTWKERSSQYTLSEQFKLRARLEELEDEDLVGQINTIINLPSDIGLIIKNFISVGKLSKKQKKVLVSASLLFFSKNRLDE